MHKWLYRGIGLVLFLFILRRVDYAAAIAGCRQAVFSSPWLAWVPFIFLPTMALKAWRWGIILQAQGIEVPFEERFVASLSSFFAGFLTPGRVGELLKVTPLTQRGYPSGVAFVSIVLERVLDLACLLVVAWLGGTGLAQLPRMPLLMASLVILGVGMAGIAFLARPRAWLSTVGWLLPSSLVDSVGASAEAFAGECVKLTARHWGWASVGTLLAWVCYYMQVSLLCLALAIPLSLLEVIVVGSIAMVASILPITVMGLGTREASLLFLFHALGLPQTQALSLSMLLLALSLAHTLFGCVAWWYRPLMLRAPQPLGPKPGTEVSV